MEVEETKYKIRCESGLCKNRAVYTVNFGRGAAGRIHMCADCAEKLCALLSGKTKNGKRR